MTRIVAAASAALGVASVGFGFGGQPYAANALHLKTRMFGTQLDDSSIEKGENSSSFSSTGVSVASHTTPGVGNFVDKQGQEVIEGDKTIENFVEDVCQEATEDIISEDRVVSAWEKQKAIQEPEQTVGLDGAIQAEKHSRNWMDKVCDAAQKCLNNWTQARPLSRGTSADWVLNDYWWNSPSAMQYNEKKERQSVNFTKERETAWAAYWLKKAFERTKWLLWYWKSSIYPVDLATWIDISEANDLINDLLTRLETLKNLDRSHELVREIQPEVDNLHKYVLMGGGRRWDYEDDRLKSGKSYFDLLTLKTGNWKAVRKLKSELEKTVEKLRSEDEKDRRRREKTVRTELLLRIAEKKDALLRIDEAIPRMKMVWAMTGTSNYSLKSAKLNNNNQKAMWLYAKNVTN